MDGLELLRLGAVSPVKAQNGGLFISQGRGMHPTRVINSHELIFVKEGQLELWEEDRVFHVSAEHTLVLFPGRQHGGLTPLMDGLKFYWIHFEVDESAYASAVDSQPCIDVPQLNRIHRPERLESIFRYFLDEQESGDLHPYSASLLVTLMLAEVARSSSTQENGVDESNVVAARAHTYIRMRYDRPISPGKIAEALGYNPDYLGRVYRKVYGCTLTDAIHQRRIHRARRFLMDSEMTIEQIAEACGFADPDYFRRIFRRYMQTSPGSYRNLYTRIHVNTQ